MKSRIDNKTILQKPYLALGILVLYITLLSVSHIYNDILITGKQSLKFWDLLFQGHPMMFYMETRIESGNVHYNLPQSSAYPFTIYLIFAIWNFPIWMIEKISGMNIYNTIPGMVWQKCLLLTFFAASSIQFYRLVNYLKKDKTIARNAVWVFATSVLIFTGTLIGSQYEIVTLFFILLGINGWATNDNRKFLFSFVVAISLKYFALLCFLPLLVLREKNIWKVMFATAFSILPTKLLVAVFPKPYTGSAVNTLLGNFFSYNLSLGAVQIPLFFTVVAGTILWCYLQEAQKSDEQIQRAVFSLLMIMGAFATLTSSHPYWLVLSVPFFVLGVFFSNGNENKGLLCETVACSSIVLKQYADYHWVTCTRTVLAMDIVPRLMHFRSGAVSANISQLTYLQAIPIYNMLVQYNIIPAVMMIAWVTMLILCRPSQRKIAVFEPFSLWTVAFRTTVNMGLALLPLLCAVWYMMSLMRG